MKHCRWMLPLLLVVLITPASPQSIENYQQKKQSEKAEPNRFLKSEPLEKADQLGRYYRRAFSDQQSAKGGVFQAQRDAGSVTGGARIPVSQPLEGPIDPAQYQLGPTDVLSISLWGDMPSTMAAEVTPEGSVIVPTVGEVPVRGMTLLAAKEAIIRAVKKVYSRGEVSVTLLAPRTFMVHVTGLVALPGAYEAGAMDRAEKVLGLANTVVQGEKKEDVTNPYIEDPERNVSYQQPAQPRQPQMSLRNIRIHRGASMLDVDLLRYYATGDVSANPRLLDGDVITALPEQLENNTVSISGAVRLPGSFEYRSGDSLGLMLRIAQGFKDNAVQDSIEVLRLSADGTRIERLVVNAATLDHGGDMPLRPNDRVFVRERRLDSPLASVAIRGEVQRPGDYPVTRETTTLTQVLAMAGGFTDRAAAAEVVVYRHDPNRDLDQMSSVPDYQRLTDMRLSDMNKEDREYYTYETAIRRNTVAVDARRLFVEKDAKADITLRDGDEIVVPGTQNSVYVFGQVARPGHVTHVPGQKLAYYLDRAGDVSDNAVSGDIKVIKAGSKNWVDPGDTPIEAGDAIWVPREPERDFFFYFTAVRDILTVTVSVATVYLLFQQVNK